MQDLENSVPEYIERLDSHLVIKHYNNYPDLFGTLLKQEDVFYDDIVMELTLPELEEHVIVPKISSVRCIMDSPQYKKNCTDLELYEYQYNKNKLCPSVNIAYDKELYTKTQNKLKELIEYEKSKSNKRDSWFTRWYRAIIKRINK